MKLKVYDVERISGDWFALLDLPEGRCWYNIQKAVENIKKIEKDEGEKQ